MSQPKRWKFNKSDDLISPVILNEEIGFGGGDDGDIVMEFEAALNSGDVITSITSAAFADIGGSTKPTISNSEVSDDGKSVVLFLDTDSATANTYTGSVKVGTAYGETIPRKGKLVLS